MKQLYNEIEFLTANLQQKKNEVTNKIKDIKGKAKDVIEQKLGEFKQNYEEESKRL